MMKMNDNVLKETAAWAGAFARLFRFLNANCPSWARPSHKPGTTFSVLGTCGNPCRRCVKRVAFAGSKVELRQGNVCHAVGQYHTHLCIEVGSDRSRTDGMMANAIVYGGKVLPYSGLPLTGNGVYGTSVANATTGWSAGGTLLGRRRAEIPGKAEALLPGRQQSRRETVIA